jgi:endonuclease-3 related protein
MTTTRQQLTEIYEHLSGAFGPQRWWPGETRFEIIAGAILTQNTSWANVAKAIANLKGAKCLEPDMLHAMDRAETGATLSVRPAYFPAQGQANCATSLNGSSMPMRED